MDRKHPFFWLANGYIVAGLLAGLGLGVMAGPQLRHLLPSDAVLVSGSVGMSCICISAIAIGFLNLRSRKLANQRDS